MTIDTSKEAVERLLGGVTPGPWTREAQSIYHSGGHGLVAHLKAHEWHRDWPTLERDGDFIAAARELIPALAAERDAQTARADAAEVREKALLSSYDEERKVMVENVALKAEVARLTADLDWLKRSIFGSANYHPCLLTGNFAEMAQTTEAARVGALARAEAAEAEVERLRAENERLREALTTKRDYVKDVATGALVNVSPVSLVRMAKDDLDMINAALQRKAGE